MKLIYRINIFAIGLPILLGLIGIFFDIFLFYALISLMLTGLIQVLLGVYLFVNNPKDTNLKIYLGTVMAYFSSWFFIENSDLDLGNFTFIFFTIPALLAIYLTVIIFKKMKS